jgi:protein-tyrosine phosphatase
MVPSGDDGVRDVEEGLALVAEAAARGTAVLYATPHATDRHPVTAARAQAVGDAHALMAERASAFGLDLRLGWELSPQRWFLDADPRRFALAGLDACLLELPLPQSRVRDVSLFLACAEHVEEARLSVIVAHPERSHLVHDRPQLVRALAERGYLLQVNASSLLGRESAENMRLGWQFVEQGLCDLVASDGHRAARPPFLDGAEDAVARRIGAERARPLFAGRALAHTLR